MSTISRRDFMKTAGVMTLAVAASAALAGCSTEASSSSEAPVVTPTASNEVTYTSIGGEKLTISATAYDYYSDNALNAPDRCIVVAKLVYDDAHKAAVKDSQNAEFASVVVDPKFNGSMTQITDVKTLPAVVRSELGIKVDDRDVKYAWSVNNKNSFAMIPTKWAGGTLYIAWQIALDEDGATLGVSSDVNTTLNVAVGYLNATAVTAATITPVVKTVA